MASCCVWLCQPKDHHQQAKLDEQNIGEQVGFLRKQIHEPQGRNPRGGRERLERGPWAPQGQYQSADRQQRQRGPNPHFAIRAFKGPPRNLDHDKQSNNRAQVGQREENLLGERQRHAAIQQPAGQLVQGRQHDRSREPWKTARAIASQQHHQQDQQRRKRQRPKYLARRKIEVEVH